MSNLSLTDSIRMQRLWSAKAIAERIAAGEVMRTTIAGFIPIWRWPTRLEKVLAQAYIETVADCINAETELSNLKFDLTQHDGAKDA